MCFNDLHMPAIRVSQVWNRLVAPKLQVRYATNPNMHTHGRTKHPYAIVLYLIIAQTGNGHCVLVS